MLKQLLPKMFPSAIACAPRRTATKVVTISGREVQSATSVVPKNVPPRPLISASWSAERARNGAATRITAAHKR